MPRRCLACDLPAHLLGLCLRCRARLQPLTGPRCRTCARRLAAGARFDCCPACLEQPRAVTRLFTLWAYRPPLDRVIGALKFERQEHLATDLAREAVDRFGDELASADALVPVPLPLRRRLVRGFNQARSIAQVLSLELDLPISDALRRTASRPQSLLGSRRRRAGVRRTIRPARAVPGIVALLIDDVTTTGATLDACAEALLEAGAREVRALTAACTPAPGASD